MAPPNLDSQLPVLAGMPPRFDPEEAEKAVETWCDPDLYNFYEAFGLDRKHQLDSRHFSSLGRRLTLLVHPDKHHASDEQKQRAEQATKALNAAKDLLVNDAQRERYNQDLELLEMIDPLDWNNAAAVADGALLPPLRTALRMRAAAAVGVSDVA